MKNLLMFIPNLLLLCLRLMVDPRVPATERVLVAGAVLYALIPLDLIPDDCYRPASRARALARRWRRGRARGIDCADC
jgi:hypothetical protein